MHLRCFLCGIAILVPLSVASAQGTSTAKVSRVQFSMDGWTFAPTLSPSGSRVESILALRQDGLSVGNNIRTYPRTSESH